MGPNLGANYYNCLMRLDAGIGMLLDQLRQSGKADNTLVIYIGDHGAQFSRGKCSVYEAGLRIPMIVRYPGVSKPGLVRDELASTLDLLPTVLAAVAASAPKNLAGRSLVPLLRGTSPEETEVPWRTHLFGVTTGSAPSLYYPQESVRDARYKLIVSPVRGRSNARAVAYLNQRNAHFIAGTNQQEIDASEPHVRAAYARYLNPPEMELYDLENDPNEWYDLADDPQFAPERQRLLSVLRQWQTDIRDPLADPDMLQQFTAEHDHAMTINYRKDKTFRWGYLDYFQEFMRRAATAER